MSQENMQKRAIASVHQYKDVFNSPNGKKVLYDLMRQFFVLRSTVGQKLDKDVMVFNEGSRNVLLYILTKLNIDPKKMEALMLEANKDGKHDNY